MNTFHLRYSCVPNKHRTNLDYSFPSRPALPPSSTLKPSSHPFWLLPHDRKRPSEKKKKKKLERAGDRLRTTETVPHFPTRNSFNIQDKQEADSFLIVLRSTDFLDEIWKFPLLNFQALPRLSWIFEVLQKFLIATDTSEWFIDLSMVEIITTPRFVFSRPRYATIFCLPASSSSISTDFVIEIELYRRH